MTDPRPRRRAGPRRLRRILGGRTSDRLFGGATRLRGPWRVAVAEASMRPALEPGDWLLLDPTTTRWPRRGSVVVFREPGSDELAIKRVAGGPGDWIPFADGFLHLAEDEAWLLSDADERTTALDGLGASIDSRRYGPVAIERLVGRAWLRYGPVERFGRLPTAPPPLDGVRPRSGQG